MYFLLDVGNEMNPIDIHLFFDQHPRILGEGAVIERLRRGGFELDPDVVNSAFIYGDVGMIRDLPGVP